MDCKTILFTSFFLNINGNNLLGKGLHRYQKTCRNYRKSQILLFCFYKFLVDDIVRKLLITIILLVVTNLFLNGNKTF